MHYVTEEFIEYFHCLNILLSITFLSILYTSELMSFVSESVMLFLSKLREMYSIY